METSQKDFEQLKKDIEDAMDLLSALQRKYRKLTGKEFIKPLRLAPRKTAFQSGDDRRRAYF